MVPAGPDGGSKRSDGPETVNLAVEKSFVGNPVAVIVYVPRGTLATLKLAVRTPPYVALDDIEHGVTRGVETGKPVNVQPVSVKENPDPHT